jgi:CheY-like chemotaxis protein
MKDLLAKSTPPDVCLMDHQMPELTGGEAVVLFRDMGYTGPILMLTGHALPEDYEYFKSQGANGVLTKPIDLKAMLKALQECGK